MSDISEVIALDARMSERSVSADMRGVRYTPPTSDDLRALKDQLKLTGEQMAELAGVAGGQQWRKYTGGQVPREMSMHMLFFMAARLALPPKHVELIFAEMRRMGADVEAIESACVMQQA